MTPQQVDWPTEADFIAYLGAAYVETPNAAVNVTEAFVAADAQIRTSLDETTLEVVTTEPLVYACYGNIRLAILLYARRLFDRRDKALGIVMFGGEGATQIRKTDPDVFLMIEPWTGVEV